MDGTLAEWKNAESFESLFEKGYFRSLKPHMNLINAVKEIIKQNEIDTFILSAYLIESKYALNEKNEWINEFIPEIDKEHRVFVPCGESKRNFIDSNSGTEHYLLDDYTLNLNEWTLPGILDKFEGIKFVNGINDTRGSWNGSRVYLSDSSSLIKDKLYNVMNVGSLSKDDKVKSEAFSLQFNSSYVLRKSR